MKGFMKAHVFVTLKKTVLDAQGKTVCQALRGLGHSSITEVRQGKYFEIDIADGADPAAVRAEVDSITREILANPVIEDYRLDIEE